MIVNLNDKVRRSIERKPIKVTPYMITENDLRGIGHAKCSFCEEVPAWLINGAGACDEHLAAKIRDAKHFNEWYGYWKVSA
ncbi:MULTISPECIES: hypothetical protein [Streptomyces]